MKDNTQLTTSLQQCVATTCAYCGVGCGVDITLEHGKPVSLEGTREHPANHGRLCVKGTHLLDTTGPEERLLAPSISGEPVSWSEAVETVATRFNQIIKEHGKDAVAFYLSGQMLTEDYYVANKLMKGYIGSANIDTNSRLCMSSAVSAYKRAFGEDVVPCDYRDLEQTDVLVLVGSNAAWTHPVLFQRVQRAKKCRPNMQIVVIDPRKTATATSADLHLPLKPGSDAAIFNGLLHFANENQALDEDFIQRHTNEFGVALEACSSWDLARVAEFCELDAKQLEEFYQLFCTNKRVVTMYSMGINQSSSGVDKCNSIINCHLATGKMLYPGAGPFSITGQPNAMGGREVGGLANQLAAHLDIENDAHRELVQNFWQSPAMADKQGAKAVDMFEDIRSGKIKAVWIIATNPMVSMPNRELIAEALQQCDCVVVSDCVSKNDTLAYADIVLPSSGWLEKDGTVTNSERTVSRQRGIVPPPGQAKHDWQIICDVATAMGFAGFDFNGPHAVFSEWAALTGAANAKPDTTQLQLNLAPIANMSKAEFDRFTPVRWPMDANGQSIPVFKNAEFSTANKRANFIPVVPILPVQATNADYPYVMNSGRLRDQWHTMTRTGRAAALSQHSPFASIQIHPQQAEKHAIATGDIVQASSEVGSVMAYAEVTDDVRRGSCFMPIHWNKQFASQANVSALYQSVVDPISGQPESKQAAVTLSKPAFHHYVSVFSCEPTVIDAPFWVRSKQSNFTHLECALDEPAANPIRFAQQQVEQSGEWVSALNGTVQVSLLIVDKQLSVAIFVFSHRAQQCTQVPADWLDSFFNRELTIDDISQLLSAQPDESFFKGKLICSCFQVREKTIVDAVAEGCNSVSALGDKLKCGTNCGSCKSELQQIIDATATNKQTSKGVNYVE